MGSERKFMGQTCCNQMWIGGPPTVVQAAAEEIEALFADPRAHVQTLASPEGDARLWEFDTLNLPPVEEVVRLSVFHPLLTFELLSVEHQAACFKAAWVLQAGECLRRSICRMTVNAEFWPSISLAGEIDLCEDDPEGGLDLD